jgi:predicted branched-subunit amino acid permease
LSLGATLSYLPFGVVCGVAAIRPECRAAALAMPTLVFGGSSQVVVNQLLLTKEARCRS